MDLFNTYARAADNTPCMLNGQQFELYMSLPFNMRENLSCAYKIQFTRQQTLKLYTARCAMVMRQKLYETGAWLQNYGERIALAIWDI
jgi:hypothetical protein